MPAPLRNPMMFAFLAAVVAAMTAVGTPLPSEVSGDPPSDSEPVSLAAPPDTPLVGAPTTRDAITVFECAFEEEWDVNYDNWPDGWSRDTSDEYPRYVEMGLVSDFDTPAERALQIKLDGARARLQSPPMRVASRFSYKVEMLLKTENLVNSQVIVAFDFLDSRGRVLQSVEHRPIVEADGWTRKVIDSVRPTSPRTDRAVVRVETRRGVRGDLDGVVSIGSVRVVRLPSMNITTNSPFNIYTNPRDVVVTCSLSGIGEQDPLIRFRLLDATSVPLDVEIGSERLAGTPIGGGKVIHQESLQASDIIHGSSVHRVGYEGTAQWRPPLEQFGYGFYHVYVEMIGKRSGVVEDHRKITLAVVPPRGDAPPGEFGWTLPTADAPLPFDTLQDLLPQAGLSWVKLPVWFAKDNPDRSEEVLRFVEQLAAKDVETIAVLDAPGESQMREVGERARTSIAGLLSADPSLWESDFEHVMTRLSLRIRWWQLGFDHDTSFVGYDDLVNRIKTIRHHLYRFGQDVRVGLGWRWDTPPLGGRLSWDFEQMSSSPPLNAYQLNDKLAAGRLSSADRWVLIDPVIDNSLYSSARERLNARVRELIQQIVVAKWRGVSHLFVANPFSADPQRGKGGLMCTNGTPGDLLLPWRTAAQHLSGAQYVGALQLPGGSLNWVFQQEGRYLMVVWNDRPTNEVLYLGDNVRVNTVWGHSYTPSEVQVEPGFRRQVIPVGPEPIFVLGVNGPVARWRMGVALDKLSVPSVFGDEHLNALTAHNAFRQGAGGTLSLFVPRRTEDGTDTHSLIANRDWKLTPAEGEFSAAAGGAVRHPFEISLDEATFGYQPLRIDFSVTADQAYRFSVWRRLHVGIGEVDLSVRTYIDESGRLIVKQRMVNHTDKRLDFKCRLNAGDRRRKRSQVFQLGPEGDEKTYTYSNGEQLIGRELFLRAEQVDGSRVIVHRFKATR